jgi:type IV pilus assembly protein PilX
MISATHQKGAVLILSLVILIIMTLLGITGMKNTVMQERMAGNQRNSALALQSAESALRAAEIAIETTWGSDFPVGTNDGSTANDNHGVFLLNSSILDPNLTNDTEWWAERSGAVNNTFWNNNGTDAYAANTLEFQNGQFLTMPQYIIEKIGDLPVGTCLEGGSDQCFYEHHYQITARGTGAASQSESYLRTIYVRHKLGKGG